MTKTIQQHIDDFMNRPMTEADVRRIIEDMVHPSILGMGKGENAGGPDDEKVLGYANGHGIWKAQSPIVGGDPHKLNTAEWWQRVDRANNKFVVNRGPIMWSNVEINSGDTTNYEASYVGVTDADECWLYVEVTLDPDATTQDLVLGADDYFPIDDPANLIVRWRLSKWRFTVVDTVITPVRIAWAWPFGAIHLVPASGAPVEWAQRVDAENEAVKVNAAPVMHANQAIGSESEQSVSFSSLSENDQRWLFIEIDLVASTATAKFSESANMPTDDPNTGKIRWRLSKWKRTATGISLVRSAWPGGVINIPSVYGPQTW